MAVVVLEARARTHLVSHLRKMNLFSSTANSPPPPADSFRTVTEQKTVRRATVSYLEGDRGVVQPRGRVTAEFTTHCVR